jgi:hypothetical protein
MQPGALCNDDSAALDEVEVQRVNVLAGSGGDAGEPGVEFVEDRGGEFGGEEAVDGGRGERGGGGVGDMGAV